jgi:gluconate 2-dehydrogenase gamma chain
MTSADIDRRHFVRKSGIGLLAFKLAGVPTLLTPRAARAEGVAFEQLTAEDAVLLAAFADHLLPGAAAAGVAHFVDQQIGLDPQECLLMCKYFPAIRAPFQDFYRGGVAALRQTVKEKYAKSFEVLGLEQKNAVTDSVWQATVTGWSGPPPPLFYMMVRSDAVDVVYGTKEGFDELNVPYMAHIEPAEKW